MTKIEPTIKLTRDQAIFVYQQTIARRRSCQHVMTDEYLQHFPVANTPENLAERQAELAMLDDLINKLLEG